MFAYQPLSTLLLRPTRSSSPAYHGPQSTILSGKLIHICYGPEKASWVHVLMHGKKLLSICP